MALQPYSGDLRRPAAAPSFFTAAALRAGYALAAPPPPAAHPNALHREIHDERVREEYFAREIAHSRRLLDLRLRHQLAAPIYPPHTEFGPAPVPPQRVEGLPYFLGVGVDGRPVERPLGYTGTPAPVRPQRVEGLPYFLGVGVDRSPVERPLGYTGTPAALRPKAVIRKERPLVKRAVVSRAEGTVPQKLSGIKRKVSGIKRKAATTEAVNDPPQQDKKWSCSLCQVFTTSEQDLKSHLQGQKHKAMQLFTTSEQDLKSHLQGQKHKAIQESRSSQSKVADKSLPADGLKEVDKQLSTNIEIESFFCDVCKLKCNSLTMLKSHLNGKKHKEGLLNSQSKVPDKTGEQGLIAKKQKATHESHGSQSKVADKVLPVDGSKQVNTLLSTDHVPEEQKQSNPVPKKQKLFCEVCKVKCTSQSNLNSHLNGKRHKESLTLSAKEPSNVTSAGTSKEVDKSLVVVKETEPGVQQKQLLKSKRKSPADLKPHLNGKKHKAQLEELNKVQVDKLKASEDNELKASEDNELDKPAKSEVQSFKCDDCKLKCNSLSNLKLHLNGKKHKAQLEELNKVQNDKPVTAEQSGKDSSPVSVEEFGKESNAVNAAETKVASEKPATAEQSGN